MAVLACERGAAAHHLADQPVVFRVEVVEAGDVLARHESTCMGACGLMSLKATRRSS